MKSQTQEYLATREGVLNEVREILITRLKVDRPALHIDPDVFLFGTGLGLDSVDAVELVVALEDRFGLRLPEGARTFQSLRTVGTVVDRVLSAREQP